MIVLFYGTGLYDVFDDIDEDGEMLDSIDEIF